MAALVALYSRPEIFRGQQCTTGAVAGANGGEEAAADVAKLAAGRDYYTRELAADHEQCVAGHDATTSDVRHWTQRSRERQGLPAHIADAAVLAKVAALLGTQPPRLVLQPHLR
jgi:hypothetical protein